MAEEPPRSALRTEELFEVLRARILSGELKPGERLPPERELAVLYQTNRNTLREAVRRLEAHKLVRARQGQGVTVQDFRRTAGAEILGAFLAYASDPAEKAQVLLDLLEPRIRVLEYLVEQVVERCEPEDMRQLEALVADVRAAERIGDSEAFMRAQNAWLAAMAAATHNLPIRWITNPILEALLGITETWPQIAILDPSFAEYASSVLNAVGARDKERAVRITREFHESVDRQIRGVLEMVASSSKPEEGES